MAAALMRSRDAIVGTELVEAQSGKDASLDTASRLRWMAPEWRQSVLVSEVLEDIGFATQDYSSVPTKTARAVTVLRRKAGGSDLKAGYVPLATITRPGVGDFAKAMPMVGAYAELRSDRMAEILVQRDSQIPFFAGIIPIHAVRSPAVIEMLEVGLAIATPVVMRVKLALGCPRPTQFSNLVQPPIAEPAHPALPSGHATQAFMLATMLSILTEPKAVFKSDSQLYRLACRIAINRTVAGMHFPVDSAAGAVLGIQLGRYLMARGQAKAEKIESAAFDGTLFHDSGQPRDFHYGILQQMMKGTDGSTTFGAVSAVRPAPLWQSLCARAQGEWQDRWS